PQATSLFRQTSVTLVACSPVPPRALYVASLGCCIPRPARLDRFGPCRLLPRWSPSGIVEKDQGSARRCRTSQEGLRDKIPLPDLHRQSRTSPVRSLKRLRRTSPVGSRRRRIVQTD
ncbi:unnamed protein product, partial [Ascophyllum nodosum]